MKSSIDIDMDNREFGRQLEKRTQRFAVRIIQLSTKLPNTEEARVIRNQITKSGTSIGANYREANRARSKADFKNKIRICESESSETILDRSYQRKQMAYLRILAARARRVQPIARHLHFNRKKVVQAIRFNAGWLT